MPYIPPHKYTQDELVAAQIADYLSDAKHAEAQVIAGEFYPPKVTKETLLAYAKECRRKAANLDTKNS